MARQSGIDRRTLLATSGTGIALLGAWGAGTGRSLAGGPVENQVQISEGTNIASALSPDGRWIAFDLLGVLWIIPAEGGVARRLTDDFSDMAQPDWSPDGSRIAFHSYRDGNFHIWTANVDGTGLKQLTSGPFDHREARFAPDGRTIALSSDREGGRYAIYLLDIASGSMRRLAPEVAAQQTEPAWSPDGRSVAYVQEATRIVVRDVATGAASVAASIMVPKDALQSFEVRAPAWTRDGRLIHVRVEKGTTTLVRDGTPVTRGEDVFPFRASEDTAGNLIYASDGTLKRLGKTGAARIPFSAGITVTTPHYARRFRDFDGAKQRPVLGIGSPQLSPDGREIVFRALGDIWHLAIGGKAKPLVRDASWKADPAWSPDGRRLAYTSDRSGKPDLWVRDQASGKDRQLTNLPGGAALSASWSPDGRRIAFLDQNGALFAVDVACGAIQPLHGPLWEPGRPAWGPDGKTIALAAFRPSSTRYREGYNEILTVDVVTGRTRYTSIGPNRSIATRGDDGPTWSPDGKHLAYVFASTLWIVPVHPDGSFAGTARQLNGEVTDAPSWSGDSRTLLYLSAGKLRLIGIDGGRPRDVRLDIRWANARPKGRTVVRAGRLWDGTGDTYRRDVDIVIEGNRIAAVRPGSGPRPTESDTRFVDATDKSVLPGLIDFHTHRQMQGYGYGDRQGRLWLAFGITTTRSPGAPAYHMVEEREAVDSGARIAPRHFATGEAIDGSRIFYNFMRPLTEPGQLALEFARAEALGYDMVKTYVRLAHDVQAKVIELAHARGLPVASHYHYPSLRYGIDGMEHLGATSRLGYSRSATTLGAGYEDVIKPFVAAQAQRTPTLFSAGVLLPEARDLVEDERVRTLYPEWELRKLDARTESMRHADTAPLFALLERNVAQIKATLDAGWHVVTGTDAPIDHIAISLHLQLRAMVRYGIPTHVALASATRHPGALLDPMLGTITPGSLADLIVVDGDPLARIEDAAATRIVVGNGEVRDIASLLAPFRGAPVGPANTMLPKRALAGGDPWWHDAAYVEDCRTTCCSGHAHYHDA